MPHNEPFSKSWPAWNRIINLQQNLIDQSWMQVAFELALRGQGRVEPNPMVGCVVVHPSREAGKGRLIGQGWHQEYGEAHAEINALADVGRNGLFELLPESTVYVTLEPCCHQGQTPPCTKALIQARPKRVVVALTDPNPKVDSQGIQQLQKAGIEVETGVGETFARQINAPFCKWISQNQPWVIAKWAVSCDGKMETRLGESKWISNLACRDKVHQLRGRVDAVMVGAGTVKADDPQLTARPLHAERVLRKASRVVISPRLSLSCECQLAASSSETPVILFFDPEMADADRVREFSSTACELIPIRFELDNFQNSLEEILCVLGGKKVTNLLVEGGSQLLGGFFDGDLVDEVWAFIAPRVIGGESARSPVGGQGKSHMPSIHELEDPRWEILGDNLWLQGRIANRVFDGKIR